MSRRTTMTALACHVERKYNTLYFTENPPNAGIDDTGFQLCTKFRADIDISYYIRIRSEFFGNIERKKKQLTA